jgi:hypothetical protein
MHEKRRVIRVTYLRAVVLTRERDRRFKVLRWDADEVHTGDEGV